MTHPSHHEPGFRGQAKVIIISLLLLVPCFWHRYIQAGDLGSHLYNAWLAELIDRGQATGLSLAPQWNNVLFDWLLTWTGRVAGYWAAEKFVVSACVLIFFWGAFALISALTGRRPWWVLPVVAMLAYGWTFHMGFFNYYLGVGLSFWCLAGVVAWPGLKKLWVAPLALLMYVAHPMAALWCAGAAAFLVLARRVPKRLRWLPLMLAAAGALGVRLYLKSHYETAYLPLLQVAGMNGSDQLVLRDAYRWLAYAVGVGAVAMVMAELVRCWREPGVFWARFGLPLQLYVLTLFAALALPDFIVLPESGRFGFVIARLSLICAVAACGVLTAVQPRRLPHAFSAVIAAGYFALNYVDTAALNRLEARVGALLDNVGREERVMSTLQFGGQGTGARVLFHHVVDRQCIGRCWSYGNYEPATQHFRVRAEPGNRIVATTKRDVDDMWGGGYVVKPEDLPAWQIYHPDDDWTEVAIRPLAAGEKNGAPAPRQ